MAVEATVKTSNGNYTGMVHVATATEKAEWGITEDVYLIEVTIGDGSQRLRIAPVASSVVEVA
jgi:hypothetical protein